ncbi:bifunctional DNA-formamidopyrimidine glycosylase/DNA-(apurinic or apyrimidinic site) lyase [Desulfomicrobium baculatum]|uniref:Formamidopyrimidine-DNA glycosylase n=1 Tax=Desulfomicrobium baculatum (strain DSM 4028 / VKM B-1378 / X) TaxID=525897 RepID=C7LPA7_DESBD|nr:bifunctional DNA-formamidopyrimidine glycosylase/DNA-(apurinic or apyrimidinic site) lyase [Desulfomicrobium baculatum]ACU91417.1 formamidopyrimidine-DNA glycosylase [Desulfomicrobium baculatum DSM 4028]
MPELPEVETIARGLHTLVQGRRIREVLHFTPSVLRAGNPGSLPGRTITYVSRRAKLLLVHLDQGECLAFHLKMTGRVWVASPGQDLPKHTHLVCELEGRDRLIFEDTRRFGFFGIYGPQDIEAWSFYQNLGPEPLQSTAEDLALRLGARRAGVKSLLLNQTVLAGIGNIYADESLFAARIHPASLAANIPLAKRVQLCSELQRILLEAIAAGGSTISDYRNAYGKSGIFQDSFEVYGKKGQPCPACGRALKAEQIAGRTSTHCPRCQKLY